MVGAPSSTGAVSGASSACGMRSDDIHVLSASGYAMANSSGRTGSLTSSMAAISRFMTSCMCTNFDVE